MRTANSSECSSCCIKSELVLYAIPTYKKHGFLLDSRRTQWRVENSTECLERLDTFARRRSSHRWERKLVNSSWVVEKRIDFNVPVLFLVQLSIPRKFKKGISLHGLAKRVLSAGDVQIRCGPHRQGGIFGCHVDTSSSLHFFWLAHFPRLC